MTRLLYVITGLSTGGAEIMLLKVLEHLDRQRFEPHVISLTPLGELAPPITALGIPVHTANMMDGFTGLFAFWRLLRLIKKIQPDVLHTWMYHADLLGGLAAKLAGMKTLIWCIRNSNLDADKTKFSTRAVAGLCALLSHRMPSLILSCSEQARLIHVARGYAADKMAVVPNGFNLARYKPDSVARANVRSELGLAHDALLVGLIGRFDPQKNHAGFFAAASFLHQLTPHVHFLLAGNGIEMTNPTLVQAAHDAGIFENCHFLGLRDDIPRLMAALDVLASSSYGEAFPNVLGEAMACGIPCAVTDAGDSAYIVGDTGRVVAIGDMNGLGVAIAELLTLPTSKRTALSHRARSRVSELFEIGAVVRRYEAIYEELLGVHSELPKPREYRGG